MEIEGVIGLLPNFQSVSQLWDKKHCAIKS